jgi:hypothetical protein
VPAWQGKSVSGGIADAVGSVSALCGELKCPASALPSCKKKKRHHKKHRAAAAKKKAPKKCKKHKKKKRKSAATATRLPTR